MRRSPDNQGHACHLPEESNHRPSVLFWRLSSLRRCWFRVSRQESRLRIPPQRIPPHRTSTARRTTSRIPITSPGRKTARGRGTQLFSKLAFPFSRLQFRDAISRKWRSRSRTTYTNCAPAIVATYSSNETSPIAIPGTIDEYTPDLISGRSNIIKPKTTVNIAAIPPATARNVAPMRKIRR